VPAVVAVGWGRWLVGLVGWLVDWSIRCVVSHLVAQAPRSPHLLLLGCFLVGRRGVGRAAGPGSAGGRGGGAPPHGLFLRPLGLLAAATAAAPGRRRRTSSRRLAPRPPRRRVHALDRPPPPVHALRAALPVVDGAAAAPERVLGAGRQPGDAEQRVGRHQASPPGGGVLGRGGARGAASRRRCGRRAAAAGGLAVLQLEAHAVLEPRRLRHLVAPVHRNAKGAVLPGRHDGARQLLREGDDVGLALGDGGRGRPAGAAVPFLGLRRVPAAGGGG
jgi:hypothetical protein